VTAEIDPFFARMTRGAIAFCVLAAGVALVLTRDWPMPGGVLGGGVLVGISLWAIRSSVDAMLGVMASGDEEAKAQARRQAAGATFRLVSRYALLGLTAYVMIARLRLHPVGLLIGASSLVASAVLETGRVLTRMRIF
jgi:hypothetical protein